MSDSDNENKNATPPQNNQPPVIEENENQIQQNAAENQQKADDNRPTEQPGNDLLSSLRYDLRAEFDEEDDLSNLRKYLPTDAKGFEGLGPDLFQKLVLRYPAFKAVPRAPVLGEYAFLLKSHAPFLKELFEHVWQAGRLNYILAAINCQQQVDTQADDDTIRIAKDQLLCAENLLASTRDKFKQLAQKIAVPAATPTGSRTPLLSHSEAKEITEQVNIRQRLQRAVGNGGRNANQYRQRNFGSQRQAYRNRFLPRGGGERSNFRRQGSGGQQSTSYRNNGGTGYRGSGYQQRFTGSERKRRYP